MKSPRTIRPACAEDVEALGELDHKAQQSEGHELAWLICSGFNTGALRFYQRRGTGGIL